MHVPGECVGRRAEVDRGDGWGTAGDEGPKGHSFEKYSAATYMSRASRRERTLLEKHPPEVVQGL